MLIALRFAGPLIVVSALMTGCGAPAPTPTSSAEAEWVECEGDGWTVMHPAAWFVHPADPARGIATCAVFAAEPFQTEPEDDRGWTGAQIVIGVQEGCYRSPETIVTQDTARVDGRPALRRVLQRPGDSTAPLAYELFVDLTPDRPCESGRWFYARTEEDDPGTSFDDNRAILERMIDSLRLAEGR